MNNIYSDNQKIDFKNWVVRKGVKEEYDYNNHAFKLLHKVKENQPELYQDYLKLLQYVNSTWKPSHPITVGFNFDIFKDNNEYKNHNYIGIDSKVGILSYLEEFYSNCNLEKNSEVVRYFFDNLQVFYDYISDIGEKKTIDTYFINIYTMLMAFHANPHSLDNFIAVINDVRDVLISLNICDYEKSDLFSDTHKIIDAIVSTPLYYKIPELRQTLIDQLQHFEYERNSKIIDAFVYELSERVNDYESLKDSQSFNEDAYIQSIIDILPKKYDEDKSIEDKTIVYNKYLLLNGRYSFINEKLNATEKNPYLRDYIIDYINDDILLMCDSLNTSDDPKDDIFIQVMTSILDSDSYQEMFKKLDLLSNARYIYYPKFEKLDLLSNSSYVYSSPKDINEVAQILQSIINNNPEALTDSLKYPFPDSLNSNTKIIRPSKIGARTKTICEYYNLADQDHLDFLFTKDGTPNISSSQKLIAFITMMKSLDTINSIPVMGDKLYDEKSLIMKAKLYEEKPIPKADQPQTPIVEELDDKRKKLLGKFFPKK